jgi:hypothetical protein
MYHGAYGHTLETPFRDERGVDAHYWAVWGALKFAAANREGMILDQIEIFRRGFLGLLQQPIPPELLPAYEQYQDLMIQEFPAAYVIPVGAEWQISPHQPARLVDFLLFNGVEVEQAVQPFTLDGVAYPAGSYVVWLTQPKRGLANTILDAGLDLSGIPGLYFYSPPAVWSNPYLWGVTVATMEEPLEIVTRGISGANPPRGSVAGNGSGAYAFYPTSIAAIQATNALIARGSELYRVPEPAVVGGTAVRAGAIIIPPEPALANELVNGYALDLLALESMPEGAVPLREQRIAAALDEGGRWLLSRLGFSYDAVGNQEINQGALAGYDLFVNELVTLDDLGGTGEKSFADFIGAGGDYVGLGDLGAELAEGTGLLTFDLRYPSGNSIVRVTYDLDDGLSAGFAGEGYAFMNYSALFADPGPGVAVAAALPDEGAFLVSGFWPGWEDSGAAGLPVVIHNAEMAVQDQDTILIGLDVTFRAHPEDTFRLLGNAIYAGLE